MSTETSSSRSPGAMAREPRWLSAEEEQAWRAYLRMRTLLDLQIQRDLAADSGLSYADYHVLSTLSEAEGHRWRSSEFADRLMWSRSRLSHQIGRMAQRGLVVREATPDDGRGTWVVMTPKGWRSLREAAPFHVASVRRNLIDLLDDRDIAALQRIATRVTEHLSA